MKNTQIITITLTILVVLFCFVFMYTQKQNDKPSYTPPISSTTKNDKADTKQDEPKQEDKPDEQITDLLQLYDFSLTRESSPSSEYSSDRITIEFTDENLANEFLDNRDVYDITLTLTIVGYYDTGSGYLNNEEIHQFSSDVVGKAYLKDAMAANTNIIGFNFSTPYLLPPEYDSINNPYSRMYVYNADILITNKNTNMSQSIQSTDYVLAYYSARNELFLTDLLLIATKKTN